jgi:hypothetical protein
MNKHISNVGVLFVIWGILSILFGLTALVLVTSGILDIPYRFAQVMVPIGILVAFFCTGTGILEIIGGWGLLKHRRWSRSLVIVMAVINLTDLPLGIALGVYALWVLFKTESEQILVT